MGTDDFRRSVSVPDEQVVDIPTARALVLNTPASTDPEVLVSVIAGLRALD